MDKTAREGQFEPLYKRPEVGIHVNARHDGSLMLWSQIKLTSTVSANCSSPANSIIARAPDDFKDLSLVWSDIVRAPVGVCIWYDVVRDQPDTDN